MKKLTTVYLLAILALAIAEWSHQLLGFGDFKDISL